MGYTPLELAAAFIKTGELNDALDALNQQLTAEPHDQTALRLRAEVLARMPEETQWREALHDLAALDNPTPDDFTRQSALYERLNETQNALETMHKALTAHPGQERLLERLIYLLQKQGDFNMARTVLRQQPRTWRWLQWSGDLAAQSGDDAAALSDYGEALTLLEMHSEHRWVDAIRARLLLARADIYRRLSQLDGAEADYQAAALLMPGDPVIPFNRGLIAAQRGEMEQALTLCRDSLGQASAALRAHMENELQRHYPALAVLLSQN